MITPIIKHRLSEKRFIMEYYGLSTDSKPIYQKCDPQPSKERFEANETHYFTLSGTTYTQCSDGDPYATTEARLRNFNSASISAVTVTSATYLTETTEDTTFKCVESQTTKSATAGTGGTITTADVTLTKATFHTKIKTAGTHNFIYDGTDEVWKLSSTEVTLADYGLEVADTVTLVDGDKIAVTLSVKWQVEGEDVTLSDYGVSITGSGTIGDSINVGVYETPKEFHEVMELNGSTFYEINTKKTYMFNEDGHAWVEQ